MRRSENRKKQEDFEREELFVSEHRNVARAELLIAVILTRQLFPMSGSNERKKSARDKQKKVDSNWWHNLVAFLSPIKVLETRS